MPTFLVLSHNSSVPCDVPDRTSQLGQDIHMVSSVAQLLMSDRLVKTYN